MNHLPRSTNCSQGNISGVRPTECVETSECSDVSTNSTSQQVCQLTRSQAIPETPSRQLITHMFESKSTTLKGNVDEHCHKQTLIFYTQHYTPLMAVSKSRRADGIKVILLGEGGAGGQR